MLIEKSLPTMFEQTLANEPLTSVGAQTSDESPPADSKLLARQFADDLASMGPAIVFAVAAYPIVLGIGATIVAFVSCAMNNLRMSELQDTLGLIVSFAFFGTVIGLYWAAIVTIGVLMFVYYFVRSLGLHVGFIWRGAFCGGLVGFVAVAPIAFVVAIEADLREIVTILLAGPGLATVVGQIGGTWGESRVLRESTFGIAARSGRIQFGIRHLMVACVWLTLLLTAIRLSGLDFLVVLVLLFGWLVYQAATLWIGRLLAKWFCGWKVERQSRST